MTFESAQDQQALFQELEAANLAFASGNYAVAEPLLRQVVEKLVQHPVEGALVTEHLSEIYTAWGKFSEAIKLNQRFINVTAPLGGNQFALIGGTLDRISAISLKVGKTEQSEKLARLAAAVRAGKIDVMTLTTQQAKVPMAPPMTEHTVQIRALGNETLGAPGGGGHGAPQQQPSAPQAPQAPNQQQAPTQQAPTQQAPTQQAPLPQAPMPQAPRISQQQLPSQQMPQQSLKIPSAGLNPPAFQPQSSMPPSGAPAPAVNFPHELQQGQTPAQNAQPTADPLRRPTKDTGMLNRPDYSTIAAEAAMSAQQTSQPTLPVQQSPQVMPVQPPQQSAQLPHLSQSEMQRPQQFQQAPAPQVPIQQQQPSPQIQQSAQLPQIQEQYHQAPPAVEQPWEIEADFDTPIQHVQQEQVAHMQPPSLPTQQSLQPTQPSPLAAYQPPEESSGWSESEPEPEYVAEIPAPQFPRAHSAPTQDLPMHFDGQSTQPGYLDNSLSSGGEVEAFTSPPARSQASLPSVGFNTESIEANGIASGAPPEVVKSSSAGRSIRSLSARDMEAAPAQGPDMSGLLGTIAGFVVGKKATDQHVQQVVNKSELSLRIAGILVLTVGIFCTTAFAAYKIFPRKLTAEKAYLTLQHRYRSADNTKTLSLLDPSTADYSVEKVHFKTPMKLYLDDWQDAVDVALGRATQKQYWLNITDSGATDQDGVTLYVDGGPETEIANKVEIIAEYAKTCYLRDKKYPTSSDLLEKADLSYTNPYTKKKAYPTFNKTSVSKGSSALDSDNERTDFYHNLVTGGSWADASKPSPGEIRCCAVDFLSPRGTIQGFFVQLFDKDGKALSGVRPKTSYLFALEDGKEYKAVENAELPFGGQQSLRTVTTWLFMDKLSAILDFMLMSGPAIVFTALSFVFMVMTFVVPNGVARMVAGTLLLSTALPAVIFCFSKMLP